jgi:ADP-ribose pyrophosphatase
MAAPKKLPAKTTSRKSATPVKTPKPLPAADSAASTRKPRARKAKVLSSKISFKGKIFNVYTDKVQEPSGVISTRQVIHHSGSVVILAVDAGRKPRNPDVILIRQYRHPAGQYLLELPAGRIEPGERPLSAAKREMIEETGFRARKWTLLTKYFASPGFLGEWMQIYLAEDITPGEAQPEGDEDIELVRLPLSEAMKLVAANQIHDGKTLIGLSLFAAAHRAGR